MSSCGSLFPRVAAILALLLVSLPGETRGDQSSAAAVVLEVEGTVFVERSDRGPVSLAIGDLLFPEDQVLPQEEARVRLLFRDGSWRWVEDALQVPPPDGPAAPAFSRLRDLLERFADRHPTEPPPPLSALPTPLGPANGIPVRVLTPTLHWQGDPATEEYRILFRDERGTLRTLEVVGMYAALPAEWALTPGESYEWSIAPLPTGEASFRVRFRVLDREGMDRVAAELQALREAGLDPEGPGALAALPVFHELDLVYDALGLLERVASSIPTGLPPSLEAIRLHLLGTARPVPAPEPLAPSPGTGTDRTPAGTPEPGLTVPPAGLP